MLNVVILDGVFDYLYVINVIYVTLVVDCVICM